MLSCSGDSDGRLLPCCWKYAYLPGLMKCIMAPGGCMAGLLVVSIFWTALLRSLHASSLTLRSVPLLTEQCGWRQVSARLDSMASRGSRGSRPTSSRHLSSHQFSRTLSHAGSRHSSSMAPILHLWCLLVSSSTSFDCTPLPAPGRLDPTCVGLFCLCQLAIEIGCERIA